MKNRNFITVSVVLFVVFLLLGCQEKHEDAAQNVKQENEDMAAAKAQYENEWQQFKNFVEASINTNEQRIVDFKANMENTSDEFKAKYENKILTLEQKNIELKKKLNGYKYEGKENWERFKQEFSDDLDDFKKSLNEIFEDKK